MDPAASEVVVVVEVEKERKRKRNKVDDKEEKQKSSSIFLKIESPLCECERPPKAPKITVEKAAGSSREVFLAPSSCDFCFSCPCITISERNLISAVGGESNKQKRFELYQVFSGLLGYKKKRKKLPSCVENTIKNAWPEVEGTSYTGFKK
jgi:hypothetical protein